MNIVEFTKHANVLHKRLPMRFMYLAVVIALLLVTDIATADIPFLINFSARRPRVTNDPVLLRVYKDRAAIMWETNAQGTWTLRYGTTELSESIESTGQELRYRPEKNLKREQAVYIHKLWLENLQPGQTYKYCIVGPRWKSKVYQFRTVPPKADEVKFIVYGDSRTNRKTQRKLVRLMLDHKVDFVVNCGDLVTDGNRYEQWGPQFFEPLKGLAESVPIYIAKGNHEGNNGNYEKLLIPAGENNSYGFDYGPLYFFCADNVSKGLNEEAQLKLIAENVTASSHPWKFVSYHIPSLNFGGHWSDWGSPDALPAIAKAGVDFVITGHSHQYERFRPVKPPDENGSYVTYITSGGGGAPLYDVSKSLYHASAEKVYHFCLFHIKGNKLTVDTIDINGNIIDHLELTKTDGKLNKGYLKKAIPISAIQFYQDLARNRPK